jgi:hypothetical protein
MNATRYDRGRDLLAIFVMVGCLSGAQAQRLRIIEEPEWLKMRVSEKSVGVFAEGRFEETTYRDSGNSITHERLFVGPSLGLELDGSVYHPNLLQYNIISEGATGWAQDEIRSSAETSRRDELEYLGRFSASANILANKPLNGLLFADYDHTYRDYDFFSRVIVDSWRYGGQANFTRRPFSFNAHYTHLEEESSGLDINTRSQDDITGLVARHERDRGVTVLNYTFNRHTREDFSRTGEGDDHNIVLSDSETFGSRDQFRLSSSVSYFLRDSLSESSDELIGNANLTADHTDTLSSYYDVNYDRFEIEDFTSENSTGRAELRHQLYESLTSSLIAQASDFEVSDEFGDGFTRRFGLGFSEAYTKRIGASHNVRLNNSLLAEQVEQDFATGGGFITVQNERHAFGEGPGGPDSFVLKLPNVLVGTIEVTDVNDTQPPFVLGFDYEVLQNGEQILIRRPPGSRIPNVVLVDYQAQKPVDGSYQALNESFQIRFDFWRNLWGIYTRVNLFLNNAPREMTVQDLRSYTFGTDATWRWFRVGAEYEIYDSDQSEYTATRLFQSFNFRPNEVSTLGIEFSESWIDYIDANRSEENYRFISRYHRGLSRRLRANIEGGVAIRQGEGVDQTLATARPGIEYVIGKTSIRAEYDFEYQLFLDNEERYKHIFFVRARRVF